MKNYLKTLLVLFLAFIFIPNAFAKENVSIESVTLDSKSKNTVIINEATYEGLSINFNIKFSEVKDYAKYKIVTIVADNFLNNNEKINTTVSSAIIKKLYPPLYINV